MSTLPRYPFNPAPPTDAELIRTYRTTVDPCERDHAFGLLVYRYDRDAVAFARTIAPGWERDVVQTSWATACVKLAGDFDETRSFRSWFFRIVRNAAIDEWRRRGNQSEDLDDYDPQGSIEYDADWGLRASAWVASCRTVLAEVLAEAERSLSPGERAVFQLRIVEGLAYKDIVSRLGGTPENARGLAKRARDKLKPLLRSWWESGGGP